MDSEATSETQNGTEAPAVVAAAPTLPKGHYTMVGIDVDTTGRRLIDEIVQLSAYTPKTQYSQYIMPYMNLNPAAIQRHQVRVVTIGFYRMLKCMMTFKVVKSKSEVAALKEFLDWLEELKKADKDSQGIILIYHEERKFVPYMLLEAMNKYSMLDRFLETVKSFANGYELAKAKCASSVKFFSLRQLSKILLNNDHSNPKKLDQFEGSAHVRAKLAYEIAHHLARGEQQDLTDTEHDTATMLSIVHEYSSPISQELSELQVENVNMQRQNSFRPVFLPYFKTTLFHRVKAVKFRIVLAENGHDLDSLQAVWKEKQRDGLTEIVDALPDMKPEERAELIDLLDCHLDPEKQPIRPIINRPRRRPRRVQYSGPKKSIKTNKENVKPAHDNNNQITATVVTAVENGTGNGAAGDNNNKSRAPDSTVKTPIKKGQNRSRNNSINNNNNNKTAISSNL